MWKLAGVFAAGVIAIPILVLLIAELGYWPSDATSEPPQWETAIASRALQASIERQAPKVKSLLAADTLTILAGMKIYRNDCAGCHGLARLKALYGLAAYPRVPQFGRQPPTLTDYQAYWVIKNGIRYSGMAGFHGQTSEMDMWRTAEFVSHLRDPSPEIRSAWKNLKMQ